MRGKSAYLSSSSREIKGKFAGDWKKMAILLSEWTKPLPSSLIFPLVGEVVRFWTGCDVSYRWNMGIQKKCQALLECSPPPLGQPHHWKWYSVTVSVPDYGSWRRSIRNFNIPPPGIPRAFDCASCPGREEFERCVWRVGNLNRIYLLFWRNTPVKFFRFLQGLTDLQDRISPLLVNNSFKRVFKRRSKVSLRHISLKSV